MPVRPWSPVPVPRPLPQIALAGDYLPQDVQRRLRDATWVRSRRGVYVTPEAVAGRTAAALAHVAATHARTPSPHVFSHGSAALLWGLTLWSVPTVTHLYQRHHPGAGGDRSVRRHTAPVPEDAATCLNGLPVTTLERTVVDCARSMAPLAGLVVADSGLRAGASPEVLRELLERGAASPGMARARAVVELADAGSESAWETATRFVLLAGGLPRPATQIAVATRLGTFWADTGWEEWHLLLEYDGRGKYRGTEDLVREKRRHDAVVEAGQRLLRVTKEDVRAPAALLSRVTRLLPADIPHVRRPHLRAR